MKKIVLWIIRLYQNMPLSSHLFCRCTPTCSEYTYEAIEYYGLGKGIILGIKRILKCRPGGIYGYQPLKKGGGEDEKNS